MKRKILSVLLCLAMLASLAVLFASCGRGSKKVELDGYQLVYADDLSESTASYVKDSFVPTLEKKSGNKVGLVKIKTGSEATKVEDKEILVGNTNRKETEKALKSIKGDGYTITVIKDKIVIVGTSNLFTLLALQEFEDTYLSGEKNATFNIEKVLEKKVETISIDNKWSFIHEGQLKSGDFVVKQIIETQKAISDVSDVRGNAMKVYPDTQKAAATEILVGMINRAESKAFAAGIDGADYGFGIKDGKLIVAGLNEAMVGKSFTLLRDALRDSVTVVDGKKAIVLPADFSCIMTDTEAGIVTDFPRPEGLTVSGSQTVHDGSTTYLYQGSGVSADAYKAYVNKLKAEGYTLHGQENTVEDSIFGTYVNRQTGITVYAAYNAYKHAAAQGLTDLFQPAIRLVVAKLDTVNLLDEDMLAPDYTGKVQESSITTIKIHPYDAGGRMATYGNMYVITLQDGSFVMYDAGPYSEESTDEIYKVLLALYREGHHGNDPTADDPIRIAAWVISHGHGDHTGNFQPFLKKFCKEYGGYVDGIVEEHQSYVTVDRLIANFISDEEAKNCDGNLTLRNKYAEYSTMVHDAEGEEQGFKYYKVHTGQKFWLANVEFEIMHTHEDQYPNRSYNGDGVNVYNEKSLIFRTHIYHTVGGSATGGKTSTLWLGDGQTLASRILRATYGDKIQTEQMQYAHHGYNGCEWALYKMIKPTLIWWPQGSEEYSAYNNDAHASSGGANGVNYKVITQLSSVQWIILGDHMNYTVTVLADGARYELYNKTNQPYGIRHVRVGEEDIMGSIGATLTSTNNTNGLLYTTYNTKYN